MKTTKRVLTVLALLVIVLSLIVVPAAADEHEEEEDDDSGITISFDKVVDAIQDLINEFTEFTGSLDDLLIDVGLTLLVKPFQLLAEALSDVLTYMMVSYPDVRHPDVVDLHWLVYQLTLLLAIPAFIWIGFQHMTGRADGIRPTAHLLFILVVGGLAPWLLYYPVELSRLASVALQPESPPVMGTVNLALMTAVVIWLKAIVLLFLALLYVVRDFFLMWFTVSAPLIFLLSYFRPTRQHMSPLIGLFIGFLLIAPLDLIAYRLVLALVDMNAASPVPHYIWGLGGYFVLLALPYVILSAGSSMMLPALTVAQAGASRAGNKVRPIVREKVETRAKDWMRDKPTPREIGGQARGRVRNRFLSSEEPEEDGTPWYLDEDGDWR